jgi:hypothetical protein
MPFSREGGNGERYFLHAFVFLLLTFELLPCLDTILELWKWIRNYFFFLNKEGG